MPLDRISPDRRSLDRMLAARSVAVVGASARAGSLGERLSIEALRSRGATRVHLVNPRYDEVQGRPCLPSLADLPGPVDLVLLGTPDAQAAEQVGRAVAADAGGVVVFGTAAGQGDAIREAAQGMPVCGAGCMGFVNLTHGLRAVGYLEREELRPGGISLVTHSGSMFSALLRTHRRLEFNLAVSSGQELVTTTGDYLAWALDRPETRVVGLFLETIRDPDALRAALATAAERDVPVVALTVGASVGGRALVTAHSGALAGDDAAWEALCATYGVHRARDVDELVDTLELFSVGRRVRRRAGGIATVHDSGAERVLVADVASEEGVPFAPLATPTLTVLERLLDDGLVATNPLDVWGRGADTEGLFTACLQALAADPGVDVLALAIDLVEEYDGAEDYPRAALRVADVVDQPFVVLSSVAAAVDQAQAATLRAAGVPVLEGVRSGLRAIAHLRAHGTRRVPPPVTPTPATHGDGLLPAWLSATDTLTLLADAGIPVARTLAATTVDQAVAAAGRLGYPVVLKTDEEGIAHRVRVGGVRLDLADEPALRAAYQDLASRLGPRTVVQPQLPASPEVALGIVADPLVGPILLLASGGTAIEEASVRALALPPLNEAGARALVDRWRDAGGSAEVETEPLVAPLLALSALATAYGPRLAALDVNPLLMTAAGPVAVDALIQGRVPRGAP